MSRWNYQKWGSPTDLIHKSDLYGLPGLSPYGCLQQFKRRKQQQAEGIVREFPIANGKMCAGNALHSTVRRALTSGPSKRSIFELHQGISEPNIRKVFEEEFGIEVAGRDVNWHGRPSRPWLEECIAMLFHLFQDLPERIKKPVLVEAGFVYPIADVWLTGSIDLIYETHDGGIGMCDWKSGAQKPHQIELDHGWEAGVYGNACKSAVFLQYETPMPEPSMSHRVAMERQCMGVAKLWDTDIRVAKPWCSELRVYPAEIFHVHLRDYVPYTRSGSKMMQRPEEMVWAGIDSPQKVPYQKGDLRGPGWYEVKRSDQDTPRLRSLLKAVVSWVRMGQFPAGPGEKCTRCSFQEPCLLDGYKPVGKEMSQLKRSLKQCDYDGFGGEM